MLTRAIARSVLVAILSLPCIALGGETGGNNNGPPSSGPGNTNGGGGGGAGSPSGSGPYAPGGGSGGTVGSLPMVVGGFDGPLASGVTYHVQNTSSGTIIVLTPPNPGLIAGYVWVVDGAEANSGWFNPSFPSISFYAADVTSAYAAGASSVKVVFFGFDGQILGGCLMPQTF